MMVQGMIVFFLICVGGLGGGGSAPQLSCNYDAGLVHQQALLSQPLQVPLSLPRTSDARPPTPIHQKYNLRHHVPREPNLELPGLRPLMVHNDFVLVYQFAPPVSFFEVKQAQAYHLLQSQQFVIMLSNPSQLFTICLNQIFSDSQSITKSLRRPLPLCIAPFTKYPLHFNLYVTALKNREQLRSAVFFNATIKYQHAEVLNRIWMKEVKFNLMPNHLKMYALQLKNCRQDNNIISIKNHEKQQITLKIEFRFRKFFMNGDPFNEPVKIMPQKIFRFMVEAKDATLTIYSYNNQHPQKVYPALYVPLYCLQTLTIQYLSVGILTSSNLALTYPLVVTSHANYNIHIEEIALVSTSQTVQLVKMPSLSKLIIPDHQKRFQIASFTVRSSRLAPPRSSFIITLVYHPSNSSTQSTTLQKTFTYSELQSIVTIGGNRFYSINELISQKQLDLQQKSARFNYTVVNYMQIPIRLERVLFNPQIFRMHWNRYTASYVHPLRKQEEILLEYIGNKNIPISPVKYAVGIQMTGGIVIPFEAMVYDNTLVCLYQGRQDRCSKLKTINFGYQKTDKSTQIQTVTMKNLNPTNITLTMQPYSLPQEHDLQLSVSVGKPFPYYAGAINHEAQGAVIQLRSGHAINFTFKVTAKQTTIGQMKLLLTTQYEQIQIKLKFNFEPGKLLFTPSTSIVPFFDSPFTSQITLSSTYHYNYTILQLLTSTNILQFNYNQSQEYSHLKNATIKYTYNPFLHLNMTGQCCNEEFVRNKLINMLVKTQEEETQDNYQVKALISSDVETVTNIKVQPQRHHLIQQQKQRIDVNVLRAKQGGTLCLNITNPYSTTLKYTPFLLPLIILDKPKDYFLYLRYAKRQKVQTYFCYRGRNQHLITAYFIKQLFKLENLPIELMLREKNNNLVEKNNLSSNDYVNGFIGRNNGGKASQICYKFNSILYFKLMIQSEIVNDLLQRKNAQFTQQWIEKEHHYLNQGTFSTVYDELYHQGGLNLDKYCQCAVYPIFRFCHTTPFKLVQPGLNLEQPKSPKTAKKVNRKHSPSPRFLQPNSSQPLCYLLSHALPPPHLSYYLVLANNHSKFDNYELNLQMVSPKISIGDISFEQKHNINHQTFVKHYFNALHRALFQEGQKGEDIMKENGIQHRNSIVPVYFTNEDYDDQFGLFKGSRYFQIVNEAPIQVQFSHYGFQNTENIQIYQGFSLVQLNTSSQHMILPPNSRSTFRLDFSLSLTFPLNFTNPLTHNILNLYLYKHTHYHVPLHLCIKVADNVINKIKNKQTAEQYQHKNYAKYYVLNLVSFAFICAVIIQLKKEEENKRNQVNLFKEKITKISAAFNQEHYQHQKISPQISLAQEKIRKRRHILPPEAIGQRSKSESETTLKPCFSISEDQLDFFRTLKVVKEDRSIISESSQSEPQIRLSHEESEKHKTEEEEKSIRSQSGEKSQIEEIKPENENENSDLISSQNNFDDEEENSSDLEGSEHSLTESYLPDGISVCNDEIDIDQNFEFGFEKEIMKKKKSEKDSSDEIFEYKWFENQNPLKKDKKDKKDKEPFPWLALNDKKKTKHSMKYKPRKQQ